MSICHPGTGSEDSGSIKKEKNETGLRTLQLSSGGRRADSYSSAPAQLCSYVINNGQKIVFAKHSDVILKLNFDF